ncbi:MAG: N-acetylmuramoyl-L-alanine amidase [Pasteurellaceae bacterium]|nr:N-acetylmuramoyl-L-alanine amidase [Pasteurellaceae bacterium]
MKKKLFPTLALGLVLVVASVSQARTVVVIDAGHGGKDPGAIGKNLGLKEKDVTLSIARELKALLDANPNFRPIMTRNGNYFVELQDRTKIARKSRANYLVSIHADSSPNSENLKGASVWVLSNRRASDELGKWLENNEKQSELLGGAASVLAGVNEPYLNQTVLDLQFSHARRSGYELGQTILNKLKSVTTLFKSSPQYASLSVLRSPDITSILVETGFLSNATEEQKLANKIHQRKLAQAIYQGLVEYRKKTASSSKTTKESPPEKPTQTSSSVVTHHIVQPNETLYSIARLHKTTPEKLRQLNNLNDNKIIAGKKLKVK